MKIELTHDLLAKKIYETGSLQDKARIRAERFVEERFKFYESAPQLLMNDQELDFVEPYLANMELNNAQKTFVSKSQQRVYRQQRNAKIKNYVLVAVCCGFIFSGWALFERSRAYHEHQLAQRNQEEADSLLIDLHTLSDKVRSVQNSNDLVEIRTKIDQIQQTYLQNEDNVEVLRKKGLLADSTHLATPTTAQVALMPLCIEGKVSSPQGTPIAGAEILVFGLHAQSDETGRFHVHILADPAVLPNTLPVEITHHGFETYSHDIPISKSWKVNSSTKHNAIELNPVLQYTNGKPISVGTRKLLPKHK